jgi:NADPH:quinone reductase-like Zn-dependent oxidoreductase
MEDWGQGMYICRLATALLLTTCCVAAQSQVAVISTDYRDLRKGAYQQFVVAQSHTVVRLPAHISFEQGSTFGVAFAAASLALGVSLGVDFSKILGGPDLYQAVRDLGSEKLPQDIAAECLNGIEPNERPIRGDWLVVWGGKHKIPGNNTV